MTQPPLDLPRVALVEATCGGVGAEELAAAVARRLAARGAVLTPTLPDDPAAAARALASLPPGVAAVVARDGLRGAVDPGVHLLVGGPVDAATVADAVVGPGRPFDVADLDLRGGEVILRRRATAVVLAGGRSTRMGRDKATLSAGGETLLERAIHAVEPHVDEVLVSGDPARLGFAGQPVVPDREPGQGPMMAVASCLAAAAHDLVLFAPVDVPDAPAGLIRRILRAARDAQVVVPVADGLYEPLFAVYRRSALPAIDALLEVGRRRIIDAFPLVRTVELPIPAGLANVNTPDAWERWRGRSP